MVYMAFASIDMKNLRYEWCVLQFVVNDIRK